MADRFSLEDKPLYFVTDHNLTGGRPQIEVIRATLKGGVRFIQYRDKELSETDFCLEAESILDECKKYGALLLLNDRVDAAKKIGADGVHLGQGDMDPKEARDILGPTAIIGLSTHNREEVLAAQSQPVDYINIGPMFPTATKEHSLYPALGLATVLKLSKLSTIPFTTMGGIKKSHFRELFNSGINTVAMVTEIGLAVDPESRVQKLLTEIAKSRR